MLSLVNQLLVTSPLLGRELGVDLGPHARFDRVELGPDARPERIGLGAVARDDRADGVALRGVETQLSAQVRDEGVWTAVTATAAAMPGRNHDASTSSVGTVVRSSAWSYCAMTRATKAA